MNAIPTSARLALRDRDRECARCALGRNLHVHHRRRRRVKTHDPHCPCNLVRLCATCHQWVHAHPAEARYLGLIVTAYEDDPHLRPVKTFQGWVTLGCDGSKTFAREDMNSE